MKHTSIQQSELAKHLIKLDGTYNTRDLGGYYSKFGGMIKFNKLFRSDDLHLLTESDVKKIEKLNIDTLIDYRTAKEIESRPNQKLENVITYHLNPDIKVAEIASADITNDQKKIDQLIFLEENGQLISTNNVLKESIVTYVKNEKCQELYGEMLQIHCSTENMIVLQHCRGGKDRTGYGAALVLLALGVNEQDVIADYMLTSLTNRKRNCERMRQYQEYTSNENVLHFLSSAMDTKEEVIETALTEMKKIAGSIDNYLINILHLSNLSLSKMREKYLN